MLRFKTRVCSVATLALVLSFVAICFADFAFAQSPDTTDTGTVHVTNLGRTILHRAPLVVSGTLSQNVRQLGALCQRDIVVEQVLWGTSVHRQLTITYEGADTFADGRQRVALCLEPITPSSSSCRLVARPIQSADQATIDAVAAYCRIELSTASAVERTQSLRDLIIEQLALGGVAARFAAVELIYLVQRHYEIFWHSHYETLSNLAKTASNRVRGDINLALRGLVELILKPDAQVEVKVETRDPQRIVAARRLDQYLREFPGAFDGDDAERCDMILVNASPSLRAIVESHKNRVNRLVETRRSEAESATNPLLQRSQDWLTRELERRRKRDTSDFGPSEDFTTRPFGAE